MNGNSSQNRSSVELIADQMLKDGLTHWEHGPNLPKNTHVALNFISKTVKYVIEGGSTGYIKHLDAMDLGAASLVYHHPEFGSVLPAASGDVFLFNGLFGSHRCNSFIEIVFINASGCVIGSERVNVRPGQRGGVRDEDYLEVKAVWCAPQSTTGVTLQLVKQPTKRGSDSYLFFTRLSLQRDAADQMAARPIEKALRLPQSVSMNVAEIPDKPDSITENLEQVITMKSDDLDAAANSHKSAPRQLSEAGTVTKSIRFLAVLPTINHYGGVISVLNMLEEFMELGHHCVVATLSKYAKIDLVTRFSPIWILERDKAAEYFKEHSFDFVIASSWETVEPALAVANETGAKPIYFVQDLEADFIDRSDGEKFEIALRTYSQIDTRIVKTQHLRRRLLAIGSDAHVIRPGMNLNIFYPRKTERDGSFRVLAMARPKAPNNQRGFDTLVTTFRELKAIYPDITIGLFGDDDLASHSLPFPFRDFGRLGPKNLPAIYSWADVYIDASRFHGFGRTGVEAMACGCVCILSDSGGIRDYCEDENNGLIVPVDDSTAIINAIKRLKSDSSLLARLRINGLKTVAPFDDQFAAREFLDVCLSL